MSAPRSLLAGLAVLSALFAVALGSAGAQAPEGIPTGPQDFAVAADISPQVNGFSPDISKCKGEEGNARRQTCNFDHTELAKAQAGTGTANWISQGLSGSMKTVCDYRIDVLIEVFVDYTGPVPPVSMPPPATDYTWEMRDFSGTGTISCTWEMDFGAAGSMYGSIQSFPSGGFEMKMGKVPDKANTLFFEGNFDVDVASGSGRFERAVGGGKFAMHNELVFDTKTGQVSSSPPTASAAVAPSIDPAKNGGMALTLKQGKPRTEIVFPSRAPVGDTRSLRAVTQPQASCTGLAKYGAKRVSFGKASADQTGQVRFKGAVGKKLAKGSWNTTVSCAYRSGGKKLTATGKRTIKIA